MYIPGHFDQSDIAAIHQLIEEQPLGTLVTHSQAGLSATHIPFELARELGRQGALRGHVARANPVWRDTPTASEVLVIFQGANGYVSPNWYASKAKHGKVVPTWNYVVAHVYGRLRTIEDTDWLRAHVDRLTARHEAASLSPWSVDDAPAEFTEKLLTAVIGLEIEITRVEGKWKVSQNRPADDREGVVNGLRKLGSDVADKMADHVETAKR